MLIFLSFSGSCAETLLMSSQLTLPLPASLLGIHLLFVKIGRLFFKYHGKLDQETNDHLAGDCSRTQNWQFIIPQTRLETALKCRR